MVRAYWDLLKMQLDSIPKNYEMLCIVLKDIRDRLCELTPNNIKLQNEIYEALDIEWLSEMLKNNAVDPQHVIKLIGFIIYKIKQYSAPAEDMMINTWEIKVKNLQVIEYSEFLPEFFKECFKFLDIIDQRLQDMRSANRTS